MKRERLFYLDLIRAISIVFVILYHFNIYLGYNSIKAEPVVPAIKHVLGMIGVSLFIIISGASLMYTNKEKLNLKRFYTKRFMSIYPTFWIGYIAALLHKFYIDKVINHDVPNWTIILSILGIDGYFSILIPNFYLVGEWFLGFIIILYLFFPILREGVLKNPKISLVISLSLYIGALYFNSFYNIFKYPDIFSRLPEFLFGLYFITYIKKINIFHFAGALFIMLFLIMTKIDMHLTLKGTLLGISSFIVMVYVSELVKNEKVKKIVGFISKYSFAAIIANQVSMKMVMKGFMGRTLTVVETYLLLAIVFIVIFLIAYVITKIANNTVKFIVQKDQLQIKNN